MPNCATCGQATEQRCSKCKEVYYCSKDCQAKNFRKHKKSCFSPEAQAFANAFTEPNNLLMEQGEAHNKEYERIYGRNPTEDNNIGATLASFAVSGGKILFGTEPTLGWSNIPESKADEFIQKQAEDREKGMKEKTEK